MQKSQSFPPALTLTAAGRDHILTEEFAKVASRAAQTIPQEPLHHRRVFRDTSDQGWKSAAMAGSSNCGFTER